jgi:hypothetical protein
MTVLALYHHDVPDRHETRGRKPKDKPAGLTMLKVELTPECLAIISRVQQSRRDLRGSGVPSRSEVIQWGLRRLDTVNADAVEHARLLLDDELAPALKTLARAYRRAGVVIDTDWLLIRRVIVDAAEAVTSP